MEESRISLCKLKLKWQPVVVVLKPRAEN
jgi:hypothetical protein